MERDLRFGNNPRGSRIVGGRDLREAVVGLRAEEVLRAAGREAVFRAPDLLLRLSDTAGLRVGITGL